MDPSYAEDRKAATGSSLVLLVHLSGLRDSCTAHQLNTCVLSCNRAGPKLCVRQMPKGVMQIVAGWDSEVSVLSNVLYKLNYPLKFSETPSWKLKCQKLTSFTFDSDLCSGGEWR